MSAGSKRNRRQAIPVDLTSEQRYEIERLWFYYGNRGPKTTPGNHDFIQRFLENGIDERPIHTNRTPKSKRPTPECEAAVDAILAGQMPGTPSNKRVADARAATIAQYEEDRK